MMIRSITKVRRKQAMNSKTGMWMAIVGAVFAWVAVTGVGGGEVCRSNRKAKAPTVEVSVAHIFAFTPA